MAVVVVVDDPDVDRSRDVSRKVMSVAGHQPLSPITGPMTCGPSGGPTQKSSRSARRRNSCAKRAPSPAPSTCPRTLLNKARVIAVSGLLR